MLRRHSTNDLQLAERPPKDGFARPIDRRKFLGGVFLTSVGAAMGIKSEAASAAGTPTRPTRVRTTADGRTVTIGPRMASDGLPQASVGGTFIATQGNVVFLKTELLPQPVGIILTPSTSVVAGGHYARGDVSWVQRGDELFVGTYFDSLGRRVAGYAIANMKSYWAEVSSVAGNVITCATDDYGDAPNSKVPITITEATRFFPSPPSTGSYVYVMATTSTAGKNPSTIWARDVRLVTTSSW